MSTLKELRGVEEYECEQLSRESSLSNSSSGDGGDSWVRSFTSWLFPNRINSSTQSTESQGLNDGSMSSQSSQLDRKLMLRVVWVTLSGFISNPVRVLWVTLKGSVGNLVRV